MTTTTNPNHIAQQRERNHANSKNPDSTFHRFLCPVCKQSKSTTGRQYRGWKKGYRCADCKAAREARIAAKALSAA